MSRKNQPKISPSVELLEEIADHRSKPRLALKNPITHEKFKSVVRRYIIKHYRSNSGCSAHFGKTTNFITRCLSGDRYFPEALLEEMGYAMKKEKMYYRIEKDYE